MRLGLDQYAQLDSTIHRWEQRSKLVALIALIFSFAFVDKLVLLPPMILITAVFYLLSKLPFSFLLNRLRYPGLFILAVVLFLPFAAGETTIYSLGWLEVKQEGVEAVLLIATRFLCILTISLVLFATAPFMTSIKAMRSLRLPDVMVDMTLLAYRYLEEFGETRTTMQRAMRLRGFKGDRLNRRTLTILAGLAGSLLIRSYERSQRVYQAMILRGYGNTPGGKSYSNEFASDISEANLLSQVAFWLTLLIASCFITASFFL
ncbi:MAG: cobalt ECF transporter T component CbiQ [Chroococcales cyanobacterium]